LPWPLTLGAEAAVEQPLLPLHHFVQPASSNSLASLAPR
jgi:hypothetical protein